MGMTYALPFLPSKYPSSHGHHLELETLGVGIDETSTYVHGGAKGGGSCPVDLVAIQLRLAGGQLPQLYNLLEPPTRLTLGTGARRFFVLDVDGAKSSDETYWTALYNDLNDGGYEQYLKLPTVDRLDWFSPAACAEDRRGETSDAHERRQFRAVNEMSAELGRVAGRRHRGDSTVRFELGDTHATEYLRNAYEDYCKANSERPLGSKGFSQNMIKICGPRTKIRGANGYKLPDEDTLRRKIDELLRIK